MGELHLLSRTFKLLRISHEMVVEGYHNSGKFACNMYDYDSYIHSPINNRIHDHTHNSYPFYELWTLSTNS